MHYCAVEIGKIGKGGKIPCDFQCYSDDELDQHQFKIHGISIPKKPSRWDRFSENELRMIAYGLSQIRGDSDIDKMLGEINPIIFPSLSNEKPKLTEVDT